MAKTQDPELNKTDRNAINTYYLESNDIEKIRHLL